RASRGDEYRAAGLHVDDAAYLPAFDRLAQRSESAVEPLASRAERQFVNEVGDKAVGLIEARAVPVKAQVAERVIRLKCALYIAVGVGERLAEGVVRLQLQPLRQSPANFHLERVVIGVRAVDQCAREVHVRIGQEKIGGKARAIGAVCGEVGQIEG